MLGIPPYTGWSFHLGPTVVLIIAMAAICQAFTTCQGVRSTLDPLPHPFLPGALQEDGHAV